MVTQTIYSDKDTFADEAAPGTQHSTGWGIFEINETSGERCRGFLNFDITSAPISSDIDSVILYLQQDTAGSGPADAYFQRITGAWIETLTWNTGQPTYTSTNQYTHSIPSQAWAWRNFDVTNIYRDSKNTGNTFGIRMAYVNEGTGTNRAWFRTRESDQDPYIVITYTPHRYVKTTGDDAKTGTSWAQAWKTINKAATTVADGSIVHIGFGDYTSEPVGNKIAPQNIGATGIYYKPETAETGGGTGTVSVEQNA